MKNGFSWANDIRPSEQATSHTRVLLRQITAPKKFLPLRGRRLPEVIYRGHRLLPFAPKKLSLIHLCILLGWLLGACSNPALLSPPAGSPANGATLEETAWESPAPAITAANLAGEITPSLLPSPATQASSALAPFLTPTHATPSPTPPGPECREKKGQMETGELVTDLLSKPLEFRVYTPPCYRHDTRARYPVLYLIHGQSFTDDQWDRLGADESADALISAGEIPPLLIVMPRDRLWSQPDKDGFGEAVVQALVPWIDSHYPTLTERKYRAIGGLSRGAGWAVHLALRHWELFGILGAHSLPVFWSDVPYIKEWLDHIPYEQMPRIYLDIGDKDRTEIMESAVWFENLLTKRGIPHEWHLFAGYHEERYWQSHVEQYLRWYAENW